jgi:hypothetical protein
MIEKAFMFLKTKIAKDILGFIFLIKSNVKIHFFNNSYIKNLKIIM